MLGDPREAAEQVLLAKLSALTPADGLPETFRFVTRELTHLGDIDPGQLPCALLELEEQETMIQLGGHVEVTLPGRVIVCFARTVTLSATTANAYRAALEKMLLSDIDLGGLIDGIWPTGTLMYALWQDIGLPALGVTFRCLYEYDGRFPPIVGIGV